MAPEKILDRIKKMMALQNDSAATQGEIENSARMVQELLLKYNLNMNEVLQHQEVENYEHFQENPKQVKREGKWLNYLYNTIAQHHFCHVVVTAGRANPQDRAHVTYIISIVGQKSNVEVVTYLCSWLTPKIRQMAAEAYKTYYGSEKQGQFTRGYLMGCVSGINAKLREGKETFRTSTPEANALVVRRDTELANAVTRIFPKLGRARGDKLRSADGRSQGYEAGKNMNLTKGIGEQRKNRLIG